MMAVPNGLRLRLKPPENRQPPFNRGHRPEKFLFGTVRTVSKHPNTSTGRHPSLAHRKRPFQIHPSTLATPRAIFIKGIQGQDRSGQLKLFQIFLWRGSSIAKFHVHFYDTVGVGFVSVSSGLVT